MPGIMYLLNEPDVAELKRVRRKLDGLMGGGLLMSTIWTPPLPTIITRPKWLDWLLPASDGQRVVTADGKFGIGSTGKANVFDSSGECAECCGEDTPATCGDCCFGSASYINFRFLWYNKNWTGDNCAGNCAISTSAGQRHNSGTSFQLNWDSQAVGLTYWRSDTKILVENVNGQNPCAPPPNWGGPGLESEAYVWLRNQCVSVGSQALWQYATSTTTTRPGSGAFINFPARTCFTQDCCGFSYNAGCCSDAVAPSVETIADLLVDVQNNNWCKNATTGVCELGADADCDGECDTAP